MNKYILFFGVLFFCVLSAQNSKDVQEYKISDEITFVYQKPRISDLYKNIPKNLAGVARDVVSKDTYWYSLAALGSTLALLPADPYLIQQSRSFGEKIGFTEDHSYTKLGGVNFLPKNFGSFLYFTGNGSAFILMSAGFGAYGLLKNDYRAQSTSLQILQSIALSGVYSQTLKRITGRESPFVTDRDGRSHSDWHFLPSFSSYQKDTPRYDAMPSGHLTTGIAAWIVVAENYPEIKWIKPVGFTLLGLMSFEMMQSKVHWASDYPIAILLGYLIGKNVAKNARTVKTKSKLSNHKTNYRLNISGSSLEGIQMEGLNLIF